MVVNIVVFPMTLRNHIRPKVLYSVKKMIYERDKNVAIKKKTRIRCLYGGRDNIIIVKFEKYESRVVPLDSIFENNVYTYMYVYTYVRIRTRVYFSAYKISKRNENIKSFPTLFRFDTRATIIGRDVFFLIVLINLSRPSVRDRKTRNKSYYKTLPIAE